MNGPERFEQLIAFVGAQLPTPVEEHQADDGSFIFSGGDPAEVIVQVTESTVLVAALVALKGAQLILIVENILGLAAHEQHRAVAFDAARLTRGLRPRHIFV